jgi:hypothetical protein
MRLRHGEGADGRFLRKYEDFKLFEEVIWDEAEATPPTC